MYNSPTNLSLVNYRTVLKYLDKPMLNPKTYPKFDKFKEFFLKHTSGS